MYNKRSDKIFDEMFMQDGTVREPYRTIESWLLEQPRGGLKQKSKDAEAIFRRLGITFAVYGSNETTERLIPFDIIPRIIAAAEWRRLERGIEQRVRALNAFLHDIYHRQEIVRAGRVPESLLVKSLHILLPSVLAEVKAQNEPVSILPCAGRPWPG